MKELQGLSFEQNKKYRFAIEQGYFDDYEQNPREWKHTFVGTFLWKQPTRVRLINVLKDIVGHTPTWEDMNDDTLHDLLDELLEQGLAPSSIKTMCAELKAVLNKNRRRVPSTDFGETLTLKGTVTQSVYLTASEMELFLSHYPKTDTEHFVHRTFCIGMMTGARQIDAARMTISNCDIDTQTVVYVPKKTPGVVVRVPIDERHGLREVLADKRKASCCLDTYNDILRRICRGIGIDNECSVVKAGKSITAPKWKLISSHTARRTFATNLYLAGISIEDIAMMMGHGKNIDTTKRYICAERQFRSSVISYFQPKEDL